MSSISSSVVVSKSSKEARTASKRRLRYHDRDPRRCSGGRSVEAISSATRWISRGQFSRCTGGRNPHTKLAIARRSSAHDRQCPSIHVQVKATARRSVAAVPSSATSRSLRFPRGADNMQGGRRAAPDAAARPVCASGSSSNPTILVERRSVPSGNERWEAAHPRPARASRHPTRTAAGFPGERCEQHVPRSLPAPVESPVHRAVWNCEHLIRSEAHHGTPGEATRDRCPPARFADHVSASACHAVEGPAAGCLARMSSLITPLARFAWRGIRCTPELRPRWPIPPKGKNAACSLTNAATRPITTPMGNTSSAASRRNR